jgi:hypothetical protein
MKIQFNVGDLIHQLKDNILYVIIAKGKSTFTLQYYDKSHKLHKSFKMTRQQLKTEFETRPELLKLFRVSK